MIRKKVFFWWLVVGLLAVSAAFGFRNAIVPSDTSHLSQGYTVRMAGISNPVQTPMPTIFEADPVDLFSQRAACSQGPIYTSLPAKCLTSQGLQEVAPRENPTIILVTALPGP